MLEAIVSGWIGSIGARLNIAQQRETVIRSAIRAIMPVPTVEAGYAGIVHVSVEGHFSVNSDLGACSKSDAHDWAMECRQTAILGGLNSTAK